MAKNCVLIALNSGWKKLQDDTLLFSNMCFGASDYMNKNNEKCTLIAIDSSTTSTGYSVFIDNELVEYGCFELKHIKDTDKRMQKMLLKIFELIDVYSPKIIVTEMTVVTRNAKGQRNLTMILGAIYGYCIQKEIFYFSFRPSEWRKLITEDKKPRKRDELKIWSKNKVLELFNIKDINDDVSDAILVGQAYINKFDE